MGCQTEVSIGDDLTFSICTHDPDTGALTDADALPIYRVYEDETAAAILNGTMAILDNANTTGFYTELVACTLANGFEHGKSYTIYIEATVDSDTGGICYGFRAMTELPTIGPIEFTYTIPDSVTGLPLAGVRVWFATDAAILNVVWVGLTDAFGVARDLDGNKPWLSAGTYYVKSRLAGYTFLIDTEVVS